MTAAASKTSTVVADERARIANRVVVHLLAAIRGDGGQRPLDLWGEEEQR